MPFSAVLEGEEQGNGNDRQWMPLLYTNYFLMYERSGDSSFIASTALRMMLRNFLSCSESACKAVLHGNIQILPRPVAFQRYYDR